MDMVFLLDEETRSKFIRSVVRMLHWRYICLWSYQPSLPGGYLLFMDGYYEDEATTEASSSAGSFGWRLFDAYSRTVCAIDSGVPGLAFREGRPFLMLTEESLQFMATTEAQRRFYQGARIKFAAFLACGSGEIELGTSSNMVSVEMEDIKKLFTEDVIKQFGLASLHQVQERSSSSSSTLHSVSLGSPEYSPRLLPMISSSLIFHAPVIRNPTAIQPRLSADMVDTAMAKAMIAVLSSSAPSSSSPSSPSSVFPQLSAQGRAFERYPLASSMPTFFHRTSSKSQHLLKLSVAILRAINYQRKNQSAGVMENEPTASQLSHVISERKRREKLNESFQALRALLPPGSKKDKASILAGAIETLAGLRAEVSELELKNQALLSQSTSRPTVEARRGEQESTSSDQGRGVTVTEISAAPEQREIELRIRKGGQLELMDFLLGLLGCIRGMEDVELMAASAELHQEQQEGTVVLRLKIKGTEWSRSIFEEMVAREFGD